MFIKDLSNTINLARLKQVMVDEDLDSFGSKLEWAFKAAHIIQEKFQEIHTISSLESCETRSYHFSSRFGSKGRSSTISFSVKEEVRELD